KILSTEGELDLSFEEWFQAWRRLLELIREFLPEVFPQWFSHYDYILNKETRSSTWSLWLRYDTEIRRRATQFGIDPSIFHPDVWSELEAIDISQRVESSVLQKLQRRFHPYSTSHRDQVGSNSYTGNNRSFRSENTTYKAPSTFSSSKTTYQSDNR